MESYQLSRRDMMRISGATVTTAGVGSYSAFAQQSPTKNTTVYTSSQDRNVGWAIYAVDASTGEQDWIFTDPSATTTSPIVADGLLYAGTANGTLFALNPSTGEEQWSFTEPTGDIVSPPTVINGIAYFASKDGSIYAVDAATGKKEWSITDLGAELRKSPIVTDEMVYFSANDTVQAVNATTGEKEWSFTDNQTIRYPPVVTNGHVYISSESVYALDETSGEVDWVFYTVERTTNEINRKLELFAGGFRSPAVVSNETVYGVGEDRGTTYLFAMDANTGQKKWAKELGTYYNLGEIPPIAVNGTIYLFTGNKLTAIDTTSRESTWSSTFNGAIQSPTISNGTMYIPSLPTRDSEGGLYAVDAASGEQQWTFSLQGDGIEHPTVVDETVYVTSSAPGLHAIHMDSGTEKWVFDLMDQNPVSSPTVADTPREANSGENNTDDSSPGFGFVGGISSLAAASYFITRGLDDNDE